MTYDRFDLAVTTNSQHALDAYVRAVDRLLSANAGAEALLREAISIDPGFALAHIAYARCCQLDGRGVDANRLATEATALSRGLPSRERGHIGALALAIQGRHKESLEAVLEHVREFPRDGVVLSLALGVYGLIAFSGRVDHHAAQRQLLEQLAPKWGDDWWFLGYLGWSRVETGEARDGAVLVDRALHLNRRNAHAVHARIHAWFELGDSRAGATFLEGWLPEYDRASQLHGHLNWHLALFELDLGASEKAFNCYHTCVRPGATSSPPMPALADSASFLWRCMLYGKGTAPLPWPEVVELAIRSFPHAGLAFADVHAAMASAAIGDQSHLERRAVEAERLMAEGRMPQGSVIPNICRALGAYASGQYGRAIELFEAVQKDLDRIAGSHAQREIFEDMYIASCLKTGSREKARSALIGRLARRPRNRDTDWLASMEE